MLNGESYPGGFESSKKHAKFLVMDFFSYLLFVVIDYLNVLGLVRLAYIYMKKIHIYTNCKEQNKIRNINKITTIL